MNKTNFMYAFFIMFLGLLAAVSGIWHNNLDYADFPNGGYVFAKTINSKTGFSKVKITKPQMSVTFEEDNGIWMVKEADYYFANTQILKNLLNDIQNAKLSHPQEFSEEMMTKNSLNEPSKDDPHSGTLIETFEDNGQLLDSIIIGNKTENRTSSFVRHSDKEEIWRTDKAFEMPDEQYSWLLQPLLAYQPELFESIEIVNGAESRNIYRTDTVYPFIDKNKKEVNPIALLERFRYLVAEEILSAQNFDENLFPHHKKIILTTFNGLVTNLDLFYDRENFWFKISLSKAVLITPTVNDYINNNAFLYENWYFKIPASTGNVLRSFNI